MRIHVFSSSAVAVLFVVLQATHILATFRNGQSRLERETSSNVTLVLNQTLDGHPVNHYPVTVVLTSSGDDMIVDFFAPDLGENAVQRLHVFVANEDDKHITELEFDKERGKDGKIKSAARLYWAPFNVLRKADLKSVKSQIVNGTWSGTASLAIDFLPPKPSLVNVAVAHEIGDDKHWDNYYSITNPGIAIPDLMVLPRYKKINPTILSSETSYSPEWVSD